MVVLKKARAYVFIAPVILLLGMHFIVWIQKEGGFSKKFYSKIAFMRAGNNEAAHKVWDAASQTLKETEYKESHHKVENLYDEVKRQRESQP